MYVIKLFFYSDLKLQFKSEYFSVNMLLYNQLYWLLIVISRFNEKMNIVPDKNNLKLHSTTYNL